MKTRWQPWMLLPLIALIAVAPLVWNGCSCGHDFDFHILSWIEAATQMQHGNLHPHWAFTPAFNAGEPRFVFYPPLSWTIGALLGMVMPWTATPIVYTWLALTAAGLAMYYLLRGLTSSRAAVFLAALYMVNPYMLFTAYERTAYAELLAAAWLPLLFESILREKISIPRIALPIALLWLTNAPAAVMGCYAFAVLALLRLLLQHEDRPQLIQRSSAGAALGLGAAAFYIVPAAFERKYVQVAMATIGGMRIQDNFLFTHTPDADHDQVLHTASLIAVGLLLTTAIALACSLWKHVKHPTSKRSLLLSLAILTAAIAFLLTPLSAMAWRFLPELQFLQFPWRFLAILVPILAITLATLFPTEQPIRNQWLCAAFVFAILFTGIWYRSFRQQCDPADTVAARLALFHSPDGTDPTDEYTPIDADNDALKRNTPGARLTSAPNSPPPDTAHASSLRQPITIDALPSPAAIVLNLRNYPAWHVFVNQHLVTARLPREDGLIAIPLPEGHSNITIRYALQPDEIAGWAISAVSFVLLGLLRKSGLTTH